MRGWRKFTMVSLFSWGVGLSTIGFAQKISLEVLNKPAINSVFRSSGGTALLKSLGLSRYDALTFYRKLSALEQWQQEQIGAAILSRQSQRLYQVSQSINQVAGNVLDTSPLRLQFGKFHTLIATLVDGSSIEPLAHDWLQSVQRTSLGIHAPTWSAGAVDCIANYSDQARENLYKWQTISAERWEQIKLGALNLKFAVAKEWQKNALRENIWPRVGQEKIATHSCAICLSCNGICGAVAPSVCSL